MPSGDDGKWADMIESEAELTHLRPDLVAAFLDGRLHDDEADRVRGHLAECDACRDEMVDVVGALERVERGRRRRWLLPSAAAAAAVAGLLLLAGPLERSSHDGVLRAPDRTEVVTQPAALRALEPEAGAVVTPGELVFTWNASGDAIYRVTVTDTGGDPLWSGETRDTTALLPSRVVLEAGTTYLWYVDALLPDGRTVTTGVRRFRTAP